MGDRVTRASSRRFSGRIARDYEVIESTLPYYQRLQDEAARFIAGCARGSRSAVVIDLGTGTGTTALSLLERMQALRLVAVDNEPDMLRIARRRLSRGNIRTGVEFVKKDALKYFRSLPTGSVDGVISGFTLHNFTESCRKRLLKEVFRVLKPGGAFANADKYVHDDEDRRTVATARQLARIARTMTSLGKTEMTPQWLEHYLEDLRPARRMTRSCALGEMADAGFVDVHLAMKHNMEAVLISRKPISQASVRGGYRGKASRGRWG